MPLGFHVFLAFSAPFGASNPLGDFPEKCPFGSFVRYVLLWQLFAAPHTHGLSFGLSYHAIQKLNYSPLHEALVGSSMGFDTAVTRRLAFNLVLTLAYAYTLSRSAW
jgi:hypothetical protein